MFSHDCIQVMWLWGQEYHRSDVVSFPVHHIRKDVNILYHWYYYFGHCLRWYSARLLLCKVTVFLLVFNKYHVVRYFETLNILFLTVFSFINFSICWWFFPIAIITMVFAKWWFSVLIIFFTCIGWNFILKKKFLLS